jgi:predicted nucleotidyltransferase component of viral defense system
MGSSDKEIITQFQREFLESFFEQTQAFFLTGGTALSAFYLHHRYSQDIDLFTVQKKAGFSSFNSKFGLINHELTNNNFNWQLRAIRIPVLSAK